MLIATAVSFIWFGMVLAISFLEAPLKFRAPGVSLPLGLGIGRIVFRALNTVELMLTTIAAVAILLAGSWHTGYTWLTFAAVILGVQLVAIGPKLHKRSNVVLEGIVSEKRSQIHWVYVGAEVVKLIALVTAGILLLN